jgi:hypothetical protein
LWLDFNLEVTVLVLTKYDIFQLDHRHALHSQWRVRYIWVKSKFSKVTIKTCCNHLHNFVVILREGLNEIQMSRMKFFILTIHIEVNVKETIENQFISMHF